MKKTDKRVNKNDDKKFRNKKKFNDQKKMKKVRQQQAKTALKDSDSYDDSSSSSENLKAACLAINDEIDKFNKDLSEKACYAAENNDEVAYQAKTDLC